MKSFFTIFLVAFCAVSGLAQTWSECPSGTTNQLRHVFFVNSNTGWAVGAGGTVLKSVDGGNTWNKQTINETGLLIGCYFVDANTGWVGGDHGVYKTTDGGSTWQYQNGPDGVTKLHFVNESLGWAVGGVDGVDPKYGDIYKTTNGGAEWSKQTNTSTWSRFYGVQFLDANTGWAYTESNGLLIKTTDGGNVWIPQLQYGTAVKIRGMYFLDKDNGWATGRTETSGAVLKTGNGGSQWEDYCPGLQFQVGCPKFITSSLGWALGSGRDGRGILSTNDGGKNWSLSPTGSDELHSLFVLNPTNAWAVGENGKIYKMSSPTNVENTLAEQMHFDLKQNYPNPFNPSTIITYAIPADGFVSLKVYDILGNEVAVLVKQYQIAGSYNINFNAGELANGIYLYQLTSGTSSVTKKLTLLK